MAVWNRRYSYILLKKKYFFLPIIDKYIFKETKFFT
jgi:hypothetical protein